jgi:hypothetical protein
LCALLVVGWLQIVGRLVYWAWGVGTFKTDKKNKISNSISTAIHSVPPHHKQLSPEQNSGEYNPMYQLVYDQQTGHAAPYQATGPTPITSSPINQSTQNFQPANS